MKGTQLTPPQAVDRLLRIQNVGALTTLSKSCINLWVAQGRFPKPITLSPTIKVWRASEISNWIDEQYSEKGGTHHE